MTVAKECKRKNSDMTGLKFIAVVENWTWAMANESIVGAVWTFGESELKACLLNDVQEP